MSANPDRDDAYCVAVEQIKQILAKYRPEVTVLQSHAFLSPRILLLLIERSEDRIPAAIFGRLRPPAEAVLNNSELALAELVGVPVPDDLKSEIQTETQAAYAALTRLHSELLPCA